MPLYEYKAYNAAGRVLRGLIDAPSSSSAYERIKQRGLFPSVISEDTGEGRGGRATSSEVLAFTLLQLGTLLKAGVTLPAALESLAGQVDNATLQRALARVRVRLSEGSSFAEALAEETIFPPLLIRLVEAGSAVGELEVILERFSEFMERQEEFKRKLIGALLYPAVVLTCCVVLVTVILTYVAPTITGIYAGLGKELPLPTQIVMELGNFLKGNIVGLAVALVVAVLIWVRAVPKRVKDGLALRIPFFGPVLLLSAASRWARTLALLHSGGVPLQRALRGAREVLDNSVLSDEMLGVEQQVELGVGLAPSLRKVWRMPPLLAQMAETGERTAALESLMNSAAEFYEKEVDRRINMFFRLMEPAVTLGLGLVVGFIVIAMLLPIFNLNNALL